MCGIAGILYADSSRRPEQSVLQAMGHAIAHRGPDAEGLLIDPGLGFVHRRLSIIDLAGGDQPVGNEDGSIQVVLNGEIYNYQALRESLLARGHQFRTESDTEVIVHLYEDEGDNFVERLRGMFALALWDRNQRRLLLARDRVGIKPLYIYRDAEKLLFASELKAILAHPNVRRDIDPAAVDDFLAYGMIPGSRCIFRDVVKLLPAHTLAVRPGSWQNSFHRYWRLTLEADHSIRVADWQEAVRAKVADAVKAHMVSDVPVGAFLSGGVDSAVVVHCAATLSDAPLQTFSMGFHEQGMNELPAARVTAEHYRTQHREDVVSADAVSLLTELVHHFDEPFADSSALPTFLISKLARQHVKVALSGDGGDEAFGGYARYVHDLREATIRRTLPRAVQKSLRSVASAWPKADWLPRPLRLKTLLTNLSLDPAAAYANTLQINRAPHRHRLLAANIGRQLNGHRPDLIVASAYGQAPENDALAGMIAADSATLLPDDYLVKVDRASMAHGLEVRPPFLDHELLELTARIPSSMKIRNGVTKWLLKKAFRQDLPNGTMTRPKQGFEMPIDRWLRGPLKNVFEASVLTNNNRVSALIDQEYARSLYCAHQSGIGRHGAVLWSLLVLGHWCDRFKIDV